MSGYGQTGTKWKKKGLFWELNPGPLAPEARIIPLDQTASCERLHWFQLVSLVEVAKAKKNWKRRKQKSIEKLKEYDGVDKRERGKKGFEETRKRD